MLRDASSCLEYLGQETFRLLPRSLVSLRVISERQIEFAAMFVGFGIGKAMLGARERDRLVIYSGVFHFPLECRYLLRRYHGISRAGKRDNLRLYLAPLGGMLGRQTAMKAGHPFQIFPLASHFQGDAAAETVAQRRDVLRIDILLLLQEIQGSFKAFFRQR